MEIHLAPGVYKFSEPIDLGSVTLVGHKDFEFIRRIRDDRSFYQWNLCIALIRGFE